MILLLLLMLSMMITLLGGGQQQNVNLYAIPEAVELCFEKNHLYDLYAISDHINPFYLRGDFNGDGKADYAVLTREKSTEKKGIVICHSSTHSIYVLGAGKPLKRSDGYEYVDFRFDAWRVFGKQKVWKGQAEGPPPQLLGEAILIIWEEAGSGLIYWTGSNYAWYHLAG